VPKRRASVLLAIAAALCAVPAAPRPVIAATITELRETFDSGAAPAGWSVVDDGVDGDTWHFTPACDQVFNYTEGDGGFAYVKPVCSPSHTGTDTELISPAIDLSDTPLVGLRFMTHLDSQDFQISDVDVSTDGATWNNVWRKQYESIFGGADSAQSVDISAIVGGQASVRIRFHYYNGDEQLWEVDNVFVGALNLEPDFNGDGYGDLATGVPGDNGGYGPFGGTVWLRVGSVSGLHAVGILSRDGDGFKGTMNEGDAFGSSVASGDFDGDGFFDIAAGAPGDNIDGRDDAGSVSVAYGTDDPNGFGGARNDLWTQNTEGVRDAAQARDRFGSSLGVGDFDVDGFWDLAIGVPGEDLGGTADAGAVSVLYGGPGGLTGRDDLLVEGEPREDDAFGTSMSAGDYDGDGETDLAVGAPRAAASRSGAVYVASGSSTGLGQPGARVHQGSPGIGGVPERGDLFADSLAAGDYDGDGFDDVAIGAPGENRGRGTATILLGSSTGISTRDQVWSQGSPGIDNGPERGDRFGAALTRTDLNGDGFDDLLVGVPGEGIAGNANAGAAHVLFGRTGGLGSKRSSFWSEDSDGIRGGAEPGDRFGSSFAPGDFDGDGRLDVGIGSPHEDANGYTNAGAVHTLFGNGADLSRRDDLFYGFTTDGRVGADVGAVD
jgi:hypothetical protein